MSKIYPVENDIFSNDTDLYIDSDQLTLKKGSISMDILANKLKKKLFVRRSLELTENELLQFNENLISKQKSIISNDNDEDEIVSNSRIDIEALINYLTNNLENFIKDKAYFMDFQELTSKMLLTHTNPEILRILKAHGWTGARYRCSDDWSMEANSLLQDLSNFYLRTKQSNQINNLYTCNNRKATNEIISFIPDSLLQYLKEDVRHTQGDDTTEIRSYTFTGACLLPDISGFSKFSGEMCSRGVSGLDELRESVNGFLGHIVETVYEFDGDGKYIY